MMTQRSKAEIQSSLVEHRLAGENLAHTRANNLAHIERLVNGDPGVTLCIHLIEDRLKQSPLEPEEVLQLIAGITGCSKDISWVSGQGYIDPRATYDGLREAAIVIREAVRQQSSFVFATGHPRNMTEAYQTLADYVESRGCEVIAEPPGSIEADGLELELRGSVYVATSNGEPVHTHGCELMEELLDVAPPPSIAIADHGFAGAALNRGIPAVCVMDTNDPGVALAAALGAPVTIIPLNDNAPGESVVEMSRILIEMIEELGR